MKKILIVEDEQSVRSGIREILDFEGFEVEEAENGQVGLYKAMANRPDLILCDIMMPRMDGLEVLNRLRANELTRLIPFIFMTALGERSDVRKGMDTGADDYLTKPFSREELLQTIRTRLKKWEAQEIELTEQLNDLRSRVLSYVPHELLTPLNGILGFSELLYLYGPDFSDDEKREMALSIRTSGQRLHQLIRKYLVYLKVIAEPSGSLPAALAYGSGKALEEIALQNARATDRMDDLSLDLVPGNIWIPDEQWEILVRELIENAFKFSAKNEKVDIRTWSEGDRMHCRIHNQGLAFSGGDLNRIGAFIQFGREKLEQQGAGLGLIIARTLLEKRSASLQISGAEGVGTTVEFDLPIAPVQA